MLNAFIYKIENNITFDFYIGSTVDFERRKYFHIYELKLNKHHSAILQNSWNKHGECNFKFTIIEQFTANDIDEVLSREQYYIDNLKPRYNICQITGSPYGIKHTEKSRHNMSVAHLGIKPTKEALIKRSLKQSGKNHWTYGKVRPDCTKEKISKGLNEYYKTHKGNRTGSVTHDDVRKKIAKTLMVPILQYSKDLVFIKEWECAKTAGLELNIFAQNISVCCKNKVKSAGGFIWMYKNVHGTATVP